MGEFSPWHLAIVAVVLVLLFGSARLPALARGLGQSMRILKTEAREMQRDTGAEPKDDAPKNDAPKDTAA